MHFFLTALSITATFDLLGKKLSILHIYMIRDTHDSIRKDGTRVLLLPVFLAFLGRHAGAIHSVLIG